jgi:3-mercaptopyruvate sulfurtransferase SseA
MNPAKFKTKEQILENIQSKEVLLVDARSADRFAVRRTQS